MVGTSKLPTAPLRPKRGIQRYTSYWCMFVKFVNGLVYSKHLENDHFCAMPLMDASQDHSSLLLDSFWMICDSTTCCFTCRSCVPQRFAQAERCPCAFASDQWVGLYAVCATCPHVVGRRSITVIPQENLGCEPQVEEYPKKIPTKYPIEASTIVFPKSFCKIHVAYPMFWNLPLVDNGRSMYRPILINHNRPPPVSLK